MTAGKAYDATPPQLLAPAKNLYQSGQVGAALAMLEAWLKAQPRREPAQAELLNLAGVCAMTLGQTALAEGYLRDAAACRPDYVDAPNNLGVLLQSLGRAEEAEQAFRQALALRPQFAGAWYNLATVLPLPERATEAEEACRCVLALNPAHADAHNLLALLLLEKGQLAEAEVAFCQALALQPRHFKAWNNLGRLLQAQQRPADAEKAWRNAVTIAPDLIDAQLSLAQLYTAQRRGPEAEAAFRQVLALDPSQVAGHIGLANLLVNLNRLAEAEPFARQGKELAPEDGNALSLWVMICRNLCQWQGLHEAETRLAGLLAAEAGGGIQPNRLLALAGFSALQQKEASRQIAEAICADLPKALCTRRPEPKPRLRIGYLSADFHTHATVYLLAGVLEAHDPQAVEVFIYSYGPGVESAERQRIRAACHSFRDLQALSDEEAARQITADEIDILVDLKGYTNGVRPRISAQRPAPLLVSWLGYPGTLGLPRLADYIIGDAIVTPPEHAAHFSESLALMPHCYQPNDRTRLIGPTPTRAEAGLPEQGFVFCNFNQAYKTTPERFALWCRLLQAVPSSVLWLLPPMGEGSQHLRDAAQAQGVAPERLIFAEPLPQAEHLGRLPLADLALDTWPCASHTTASDALWAGLPLLTQTGETFASRVAASILHTHGLPELIAANEADYEARALELARDPAQLAALRQRIVANRLSTPLFDTVRFARDLEALYARIWEQARSGEHGTVGV